MTITIRTATEEDIPWILDLINHNHRDALSDRERAEGGFVQGAFSADSVRSRLDGPGVLVAEADGQGVGVLLASAPGELTQGPPGQTEQVAHETLGDRSFFLYGPIVVDRQWRGQGVQGRLKAAMLERNRAAYDVAVAFVEVSNAVSTQVHTGHGWDTLGGFSLGEGRDFVVVATPTSGAGDAATG